MNRPTYALELLHEQNQNEQQEQTPLLFLHGIFMGAWCWEHYLPWFANKGFDTWALSFRGHGKSEGLEEIHQFSLNDYVDDAKWAIAQIRQKTGKTPIVIGHSMGGLVLQRLTMSEHLPAAVLMCAVPPQGLIPLAMGGFYHHPFITATMGNTYSFNQPLSPELFKEVLFHQHATLATLEKYAAKMTPESYRLIMDLTMGTPFAPWFRKDCPVAIIGAREDVLVAPEVVSLTAMTYGEPVHWIANSGHAAMLEEEWQDSAKVVMDAIQSINQQ